MTNETTASQPKSIGDDAQDDTKFLAHWDSVSHNYGFDMEFRTAYNAARAAWFAAPAAQASATIQAAPDADELHFNAQRLRNVAALVGVPAEGDDAQVDSVRGALLGMIAAKLRRTATIMVAEPVGRIAVDHYGTARCASCDANLDINEEHGDDCSAAAPMVAEPTVCSECDDEGTVCNGELDVAPCPKCQAVEDVAPMVADPAGATELELSDEGIVKVLASFGIDSTESKYGFDALQVATTVPSIRRVVETYLTATVKAVPSEALDTKQVRADEWRAVAAYLESQQGLLPEEMKTVRLCATVVRKVAQTHLFDFAAPLADKTGGGE